MRQPIHTVYVPADRFEAGLAHAYGGAALTAVAEHGPLPFPAEVTARVRAKLRDEPIEDLRVDFEDGYGARDDADFAKAVMRVVAAGTGVRLSDGSTNIVPVGPTGAVRSAWDLHARLVRRSLERGFYQGWDLHPAQLPTRFGATYLFYREAVPAAVARLEAYLDRRFGGVLDEPATARALARFLLRGLDCGARRG